MKLRRLVTATALILLVGRTASAGCRRGHLGNSSTLSPPHAGRNGARTLPSVASCHLFAEPQDAQRQDHRPAQDQANHGAGQVDEVGPAEDNPP